MVNAYINLFRQGYAYCVGAYQKEQLVGGIYGVCIDGIISGESMYYQESGASKVCLINLLERLHSAGISWLDTQMITPVVESVGGKSIPREEFLARLKARKKVSRHEIFASPAPLSYC